MKYSYTPTKFKRKLFSYGTFAVSIPFLFICLFVFGKRDLIHNAFSSGPETLYDIDYNRLVFETEPDEIVKLKKVTENDLVISADNTSFSSFQEPTFTITPHQTFWDKVSNFFEKLFGKEPELFEETPEVSVVDAKNNPVDTIEVTTTEDGITVDVNAEDLPTPGKYSVIVSYKGEEITQDFTWGVLAINTDKPVYHPDDTARISIAVLNEKGSMVCDADVTLKIWAPARSTPTVLSTDKGGINVNPGCHIKEMILEPDFETAYEVEENGTYYVELKAETEGGTYTILDAFSVSDDIPFEIRRASATRIYPPERYPMLIAVTPEEHFVGKIVEQVPKEFTVYTELDQLDLSHPDLFPKDGTQNAPEIIMADTIEENSNIVWNADWKAGKTYYLYYEYITPQTSPEFYTLGELLFESTETEGETDYEEPRPWQLAIDAAMEWESPVEFNSDYTRYMRAAKVDTNKVVVCATNLQPGKCYAGSISGTTLSFGSATQFYSDVYRDASHADSLLGVCAIDTNKFAVAYLHDSDRDGYTIVGTVSGTTISFGSEYEFNDGDSGFFDCAGVDTDKYVIIYNDFSDSNTAKGIACTASGTTISCGSETRIHATTDYYPQAVTASKLDTDKFFFGFSSTDTSEGYGVVGTTSGTTITFGTPVAFLATQPANTAMASCVPEDSTSRVLIPYSDTDSWETEIVAATVSGTTLTFGSIVNYDSDPSPGPSCAFVDSDTFVASRHDNGDNDVKIRIGTVDWSTRTISLRDDQVLFDFDSTVTLGRNIMVVADDEFGSPPTNIVLFYPDYPAGEDGMGVLGQYIDLTEITIRNATIRNASLGSE